MNPPVVTIVGLSDTGKTTLITGLIQELGKSGFKVGTMKHHLGRFEMDKPGKDTWLHRQAGAAGTIISSPSRIGMVRDADRDLSPQELAGLLPDMDIILAEGYKNSTSYKIEVFRPERAPRPICLEDPMLLAVVTEADVPWKGARFQPGDLEGIAAFLIERFIRPS